jgi:hypothetical protein
VRDFVVVSLKPVPKAAGATAKSSKKASREVAGLDDSPQSLDD